MGLRIRGELGHGDEQRAGAVGTGQSLQSGGHHGGGAGGVEVDHVHIQPGEHAHGLLHGVGNVVELQIQKDPVASGLDLPDNGGPLGIVQLHADLHKGLLPGELIEEGEGFLPVFKIQRNDYILSHEHLR